MEINKRIKVVVSQKTALLKDPLQLWHLLGTKYRKFIVIATSTRAIDISQKSALNVIFNAPSVNALWENLFGNSHGALLLSKSPPTETLVAEVSNW